MVQAKLDTALERKRSMEVVVQTSTIVAGVFFHYCDSLPNLNTISHFCSSVGTILKPSQTAVGTIMGLSSGISLVLPDWMHLEVHREQFRAI